MFVRLLLSLAILSSSSILWAQQNPLVPKGYYDTVQSAEKLVGEFNSFNPQRHDFNYLRYQLILDRIGPLSFKSIETISDINKAQASKRGLLTDRSWDYFTKKLRLFNPNNFQERDRAIIEEARDVVQKLRSFGTSSDAKMVEQILESYKTDPNYGAWRSLKNGVRPIHLGPEILRFATAIAVVRVATCFGGSFAGAMGSILTMSAPSHIKNKNSDPACMEEVSRMFTDPVFYAGFSAFIAGSRFATGGLNWAASKLDPAHGPRTQHFQRYWFSNASLAFGFIGDHVVKTLLHNKDIVQCMFSFEKVKTDEEKNEDQENSDNEVRRQLGYLGMNATKVVTLPNGEEVFDIYGENTACRRASRYISSHQFLKEELGVGIAGLVTTATALSLAGAGTRSAFEAAKRNAPEAVSKKAKKTAKDLKAFMKKAKKLMKIKNLSFIVLPSGAGAFALQFGNLVKFLGVFEVLNPLFNQGYYSLSLEPNVESKTDQFISSYLKQSGNGIDVNGKRRCVDVYGSTDFRGGVPMCSRIPLLVDAMNFADFSSTWRSKQILGKFHMSYGYWRQKLMSFITNYVSSKDQLKSLARGRELFLTDASEYVINRTERDQERVREIIAEKYRPALVDQIFNEILEDTEKHFNSWDGEKFTYKSQYQNLSSSTPEYRAYEIFTDLFQELEDVATNQNGDLYFGMGDKLTNDEKQEIFHRAFGENDNYLTDEEKQRLFQRSIEKITEFIDAGYIEVEHPVWKVVDYDDSATMQRHLEGLKLSDHLLPSPFRFENIKYYINSTDPIFQAIGISLFRDWMPYMYGTKPRRDNEFDDRFNPRGMLQTQWEIFNEIEQWIADYSPLFPGEWTYLKNTFSPISTRQKSHEDTQRANTLKRIDTKAQSNYALVQMSCGQNKVSLENALKPWNWFRDRNGFALEFPFPQILPESPCQNLLHPGFEGNSVDPSALRSIFTSSDDLYVGLHDMYIHAPQDSTAPLIFAKEEEASQWWNANIKPNAEARLKQMKSDYAENVEEQFFPKISQSNLDDGWFQGFLRFFRSEGTERKTVKMDTAVNSLNLSLKNELYHYGAALSHTMPSQDFQVLKPVLIELNRCIDQLLNSIHDKNYTVTKSQCEPHIIGVINILEHQNQRYDDNAITALLRLDEGVLEAQENGKSLLYDRYLIQMSRFITGLFDEIDTYNEMVNESFNFKFGNIIQEGENQ